MSEPQDDPRDFSARRGCVWVPALVAALFVALELVTNSLIEPLTYGHSAGVSTVALLVSACGTQKISVPQQQTADYSGASLFSQRCSGCHTLSYAGTHGSAANPRTREPINGPNFADVDLRVSREIGIRERAKLRLIFEGFNITNRANYSSIVTGQYNFAAATRVFTPTTNFLARSDTFDPRILQLAAKITF